MYLTYAQNRYLGLPFVLSIVVDCRDCRQIPCPKYVVDATLGVKAKKSVQVKVPIFPDIHADSEVGALYQVRIGPLGSSSILASSCMHQS